MKKYILLLFLAAFTINISAQNYEEKFSTDFDGNKLYESSDGTKAALSDDLFGNKVYKDNKRNEITYPKELIAKIPQRKLSQYENILFRQLIDEYRSKKGVREDYQVDLFGDSKIEEDNNERRWHGDRDRDKPNISKNLSGDLQYKDRSGLEASFSKDVHGSEIYQDNKGNEVKYSKDFIREFAVERTKGKNIDFREDLFAELIEYSRNNRNYKEEYEIDLFGDIKYKNSNRESASLKKNVFDERIYSDSKKYEVKYSEKAWDKMMHHHGSAVNLFMSFLNDFMSNSNQ